jgi:hypothetical protein
MIKGKTLFGFLCVFCAIALVVSTAAAQSSRPFTYFVSGNFAGVVAPQIAKDYYSYGYGFSGGVEYPVSPQWSFVGTFNYTFFSPDEGVIADWWVDEGEYPSATDVTVEDGRLNSYTTSVVGKGALRTEDTKTYPYVKGGFGVTVGGASTITVNWRDPNPRTDDQLGLDTKANLSILLGVGLETRLGAEANKILFFEAGLQMILQEIEGNSENVLVIPGTVGFRF